MAGTASEESEVGRSVEGVLSGQRSQSGEALAEWRSSEQVENGVTSTSPPYWDTDDEDDCGGKPSELYGKYTWKIEKFSQINKRELRSNAFEVGGYKWYILIYPQGCDVCNHLSLFLCVANHDKLLPGWSHFAQFTIAVVNKDPKKSKYSDTLHRFWKKEHDWGWKKFMELSKVLDGFIDADTLIIKAQVQVIREKVDRPFRCLECQYRRELVRVYLTNVEQICRRFVEERRGKLGKLIEDKARWSSFCAFWLGIDQNARRRMSREKMDMILKVVVKHFFIEKEVTSTLVMDSLYSGLKALEGQTSKGKKGKPKLLEAEETPAPIVRVENDMFVLVDDVLVLLERAAMEPLPPKDEKGPQNRTKDGGSGEDFNKDSIERDERRLTELGRRTVEIFVLAHIFSNRIEVAYQEAVALKRQEELIREEEAAWQAGSEQKAKRGASEKEKKSKKKQAKKRNNRKGKDHKGRDEKPDVQDTYQEEIPMVSDERKGFVVLENSNTLEDISDESDTFESVAETPRIDSEEREASPVNWDTDTSEVHPPTEIGSSLQNERVDKKTPSLIDDSSSTCSTDSVPSVVTVGPYYKRHKSPSRGKIQRGKAVKSWTNETDSHCQPAEPVTVAESQSEAVDLSLQDRLKWLEQHAIKEEVVTLQKKLNVKDQVDIEKQSNEKTTTAVSLFRSLPSSTVQVKSAEAKCGTMIGDPVQSKRPVSLNGQQQTDKAAQMIAPAQSTTTFKPESQKQPSTQSTPKPTERLTTPQQAPTMSRPSSAPLIPTPGSVPGPRPTVPVVSMVQTGPLLARSVSAVGRLGPEPSPSTQSFIPQSYRNAIMGNHSHVPSTSLSSSYSQPPALVSSPMLVPQSSDRMDRSSVKPGFNFLPSGPHWRDYPQSNPRSLLTDIQNLDLDVINGGYRSRQQIPSQALSADEFPHLDIINDLLDDEHSFAMAARASTVFQSLGNNGSHFLNRQLSFPGDMGLLGEVDPSSSSCRFERTRSYHEDAFFQGSYASSSAHINSSRDMTPQGNYYVNGQVDGMVPNNNWQVVGSDLSLLNMGNAEGDGYHYSVPDYTNMPCGVNGYTVFRPSNGH